MFIANFVLASFSLLISSVGQNVYDYKTNFSQSSYDTASEVIHLEYDTNDFALSYARITYTDSNNNVNDFAKITYQNNSQNTLRTITIQFQNTFNLDCKIVCDTTEVTGSPYEYTWHNDLVSIHQYSTISEVNNWYCNLHFYLRPLTQSTYDALNSEYTGDTYNSGYLNGKNDGYQQGKQEMNDYWSQKYAEDTADIRQEGYDDGFDDGKNYGMSLSQSDYGFTNLFLSIADTPVLMFRRLFDFSLFGTSVLTVVLSLFTCLIVIHIVKKVLK